MSTARWLLLPVPFLICGAVLYGSTFIKRIGLLHLSMVFALPLGLSVASAVVISGWLVPKPWSWIMIAAYCLGLFFLHGYIFMTCLPHPFP